MSLFRKGLLLLALAIAFQITLGGFLMAWHNAFSLGAGQFERSLRFTSHSSAILLDFFKLRQLLVSGSVFSPEIDYVLRQAIAQLSQTDKEHVEYAPNTLTASVHMREQVMQCLNILQEARKDEKQHEIEGKPKQVPWHAMKRIAAIMSDETSALSHLYYDEQANVDKLIERQRHDSQMTSSILYAGMVLELLLMAFFIGWYKHSTTPKITRVMRNIQRFSQQQELTEPIKGDDELSNLDQAFYSVATTLNEARRLEHDLMERQRDVICRLDDQLTFRQINRSCYATFGYTPQELIGKSFAEILRDPQLEDGMAQQFAASKSGKSIAFETRIARRDHSVIEMQTAVSWLENDHSYVCVMHDITARKHTERLRQEVLQMINHDMRTPLTTIAGAFEVFEIAGVSRETASLLDTGTEASAQMSSLVDHFLKIEKIKAGMFDLELEPGSVESLLEAAADDALAERSSKHGASLTIHHSQSQIVADRQRLQETFTDLFAIALANAPANSAVIVDIEQPVSSGTIVIHIRIPDAAERGKKVAASEDQTVLARLILPLCRLMIELHEGTLSQRADSFAICLPTSPRGAKK